MLDVKELINLLFLSENQTALVAYSAWKLRGFANCEQFIVMDFVGSSLNLDL